MSRLVSLIVDNAIHEVRIPAPHVELMRGVRWGDPWVVFTPAYWLTIARTSGLSEASSSYYRSDGDVVGELVFCMLGGFGISAELATATYERCKDLGLIQERCTDQARWVGALREPVLLRGKPVRYRFPAQKSRFIAAAMAQIGQGTVPLESGQALREHLLQLPGVGYKTASWVARNFLDCDDVAILDIHIIRAGQLCGFFTLTDRVERDYLMMESRFLEFCNALGFRPAALDCLIWDHMREAGDLPLRLLSLRSQPATTAPLKSAEGPLTTSVIGESPTLP